MKRTAWRNSTAAQKARHIAVELGEHLPYSVFGVVISLIILGSLNYLAVIFRSESLLPEASGSLFHIFHPIHLLLSATVTTAMFWKHERKLLRALAIGFAGSVMICSASDIFIPYLGGRLLGLSMHIHFCLLDHPEVLLPFAVFGSALGLLVPKAIERSTQYSHSAHVLVSSMASILYLTSFGLVNWMDQASAVLIITVLAVMIPCCVSDIVFPLFIAGTGKQGGRHSHLHRGDR